MQAEARLDSTSVVLQRTELLRVPVCLGTEDTHWARLYEEHREDRFSKLFHLQAEAGNEFVCRRKKQGKLTNQITLSRDLSLLFLAQLRGTDPNPSEVNGKTPIDINTL